MRRRIQATLKNPLSGDRIWGRFRLVGLFVIIFIIGSVGLIAFGDLQTEDIISGWRSHYSLLKLIPLALLRMWILFWRGFRYYLLLFMAFVAAFVVATHYLKNVYHLENWKQAAQYLGALLFAIRYPRLIVDDGEAQIAPGELNLVKHIGGPGYLVVRSGNVVLLEGVDGAPRVCSTGTNFVTRREKIRQIIRLEDRHGYIEKVETFTKDGIYVRVRDLHYRYRLRTGRNVSEQARQRRDESQPFSFKAVLDMVYQRSVGKDGVTPWHQLVNVAVDSAVTDYIRSHRFDEIATPRFEDEDPREQITENLYSESLKKRLAGVGAELLWADMGHFEAVDERVDKQFVETWGAKWLGNAKVKRAFGEAQRTSYLEIGRAEAQAEMLLSIIEALDGVEKSDKNVRSIILSRTAQILDGLASDESSSKNARDEIPPP